MPKKKQDSKTLALEVSEKLLSLMGVTTKPTVEEDLESDTVIVNVGAGEETGLLIGRRGETLQALQTAINLLVRQRLGEWARVVVNVGDWRQKEEERLSSLALSAAQRAKETKEPQALYNLTPSQRRVVHLALSTDKEIETESLGEGAERYLVVKPK